jgi:penicillin-binding protein 1C
MKRWLAVLALALGGPAFALPDYAVLRAQYAASDVRVLDRGGHLLERVRSDFKARRGSWIPLQDISVSLQRAVILSEDRRFYSHDGIDWRAMAAAAWGNLTGDPLRGASTISMQVLALADPAYRRGPGGRSVLQKMDQALEALELERHWSKPQILEAYLNLAAFHGELVGIDALSRVMFQKHPSGLNLRESAVAAVLLRGPNASQAVLRQRACALLRDMGAPGECLGLGDFIYLALQRKSAAWVDNLSLAPHFARLALRQADSAIQPGQALRTSLDGALQRRLRALEMANVRDAAVVVLDNRSGEVLAYVGSSGELSSADRVDHARSFRQAGSTLKPFLYAQAFELQRLTPVSLLNDSPLNLATGNGLYIPKNYDERYAGWVSARTALASSLNIPAVRTLVMVTPDVFARRLVRLGLPLDQGGDYYGYSLALGSADVTLLSLTNAYRSLANLGAYSPPTFFPADTDSSREQSPVQAGDAGAAWIVGDILSDRQARARTFGLDSPLSTPFWSAVKTGTSKDMRDNWCIGWSAHYTVGVWVGNSGGASMHDVSGVSGAGPIWHDIMSWLHRARPSHQPAPPSSVSREFVDFDGGIEPARQDVFLGDTAVRHVALAERFTAASHAQARIVQPADGAILAIDPDIPPDRQRLWLQAQDIAAAGADGVLWRVDGEDLGPGGRQGWMPRAGRHRIELFDARGRMLDGVTVEVRGLLGGTERTGADSQRLTK